MTNTPEPVVSWTNTLVDQVLRYEDGSMEETEAIEFFAGLVSSGLAWSLQGSYGRAAAALIRDGIISEDGKVLVNLA